MQKKTELVLLLDRSGSMHGLETDTIAGCNAVLRLLQLRQEQVYVTTVLFDDQYELLHDHQIAEYITPVTEREYYVRGCTALWDAVGWTISRLEQRKQPHRTLFVVVTDGLENASNDFSAHAVREKIMAHQQTDWEFLFLGANMDAERAAAEIGIPSDHAVNYHADQEGTRLIFLTIAETIVQLVETGELPADWKHRIETDYQTRG